MFESRGQSRSCPAAAVLRSASRGDLASVRRTTMSDGAASRSSLTHGPPREGVLVIRRPSRSGSGKRPFLECFWPACRSRREPAVGFPVGSPALPTSSGSWGAARPASKVAGKAVLCTKNRGFVSSGHLVRAAVRRHITQAAVDRDCPRVFFTGSTTTNADESPAPGCGTGREGVFFGEGPCVHASGCWGCRSSSA